MILFERSFSTTTTTTKSILGNQSNVLLVHVTIPFHVMCICEVQWLLLSYAWNPIFVLFSGKNDIRNVTKFYCACTTDDCLSEVCETKIGCYSSHVPDKLNVQKSCIEDAEKFNMMCQRTNQKPSKHHHMICCTEQMCNEHLNPTLAPSM